MADDSRSDEPRQTDAPEGTSPLQIAESAPADSEKQQQQQQQ
jgi:hypothetical protein